MKGPAICFSYPCPSRTRLSIVKFIKALEVVYVCTQFGNVDFEEYNLTAWHRSSRLVPCSMESALIVGTKLNLGGVCMKGISKSVEVGFLTYFESLNLCNVERNLKCDNVIIQPSLLHPETTLTTSRFKSQVPVCVSKLLLEV